MGTPNKRTIAAETSPVNCASGTLNGSTNGSGTMKSRNPIGKAMPPQAMRRADTRPARRSSGSSPARRRNRPAEARRRDRPPGPATRNQPAGGRLMRRLSGGHRPTAARPATPEIAAPAARESSNRCPATRRSASGARIEKRQQQKPDQRCAGDLVLLVDTFIYNIILYSALLCSTSQYRRDQRRCQTRSSIPGGFNLRQHRRAKS